MARRCLEDAQDIRHQIDAGGVTPEQQADMLRQRDVATAQAIIDKHIPPGWRASEEAPRILEALAHDIADAMQVARGASS